MTPWHLRTVRVLATSIVVGAVACSTSSPGGGSTASTAPVLQGSYKAVTPGSIAEITFYEGDHYQLVDGVCANALLGGSSSSPSLASCNEEGNFALASTGATLILSPTSGAPRNLPFHSVLSGYVSSASTQSARVQGGVSLAGGDASLTTGADASLVQDGGALVNDGGSLVPCPGGALTKSGVPLTQAFTAGGQSLVSAGQNASGGAPDPTAGGQWSCDGTFDTSGSSAYYVTTFGCSSSNPSFQDPGDNCCGAGAPVAAAAGLCGSLKPASTCSNACQDAPGGCNSWRSDQSGAIAASFKCEEMVNYFSTGAVVYGIGTRLCLSTAAGKGVVVFVYDDGPQCSIEDRVSAHVLDVSPPTGQALFGESQISATEKQAVFVTTVSASTPLGPNNGCASAASSPAAGSGSGGGSSPGSGGAGSGAGAGGDSAASDAGCPAETSCTTNADCNPSGPLGLTCVGGVCQSGCASSSDCPSGSTCVTSAGSSASVCQGTSGGKSCSNDGACNPGGNGTGQICSGGTCVPGCHASFQCPGNTSCHGGQCS